MPGQRPTIVIHLAGEPERAIELGDVASIGRSSKSDIVIDQLDCSRLHAELRRRPDGSYDLVDMGSRNGCFVNGVRIEERRTLADGDRIDIAEVVLRFQQGALDGGPTPLEPARPGPERDAELPAVVLAGDVAGYSALSTQLAPVPLREFVAAFVLDAQRRIERGRGTFDRMADRTLVGYWLIDDPARPQAEIGLALEALRALVGLREDVAPQFAERFGGMPFQVALGLHTGSIQLGNAGSTQHKLWSIGGDAVLGAVALQGLAEERARSAVVSDAIARHAGDAFRFASLGPSPLRDGDRAVEALALL